MSTAPLSPTTEGQMMASVYSAAPGGTISRLPACPILSKWVGPAIEADWNSLSRRSAEFEHAAGRRIYVDAASRRVRNPDESVKVREALLAERELKAVKVRGRVKWLGWWQRDAVCSPLPSPPSG